MAGLNNDNNPIQSQVRLGPQAIQLVPGPPGPPGPPGGVVTTTANFTQPAVNSTVSVNVTSTSGLAAGLNVFVQGGGYYQVQSVTSGTVVVLTNLGASGNTAPTLTVTNGGIVVGSGAVAQVATPVRLSAATTLLVNQTNIYANTTSAAFTITLPASPIDGQQVSVYDDHLQFGTNPLTVAGNSGQSVMDVNNPIATFGPSTILRQTGSRTVFEYDGGLTRWSIA